jgi:hypothetical protein
MEREGKKAAASVGGGGVHFFSRGHPLRVCQLQNSSPVNTSGGNDVHARNMHAGRLLVAALRCHAV